MLRWTSWNPRFISFSIITTKIQDPYSWWLFSLTMGDSLAPLQQILRGFKARQIFFPYHIKEQFCVCFLTLWKDELLRKSKLVSYYRVKNMLKTLQHILQDFYCGFAQFLDTYALQVWKCMESRTSYLVK